MVESSGDKSIPSELKAHVQWERCIENTLIKAGYGLLIGIPTSFLLFRSPAGRSGLIGLCTGIGIGRSYMECRYDLEGAPKSRFSTLSFPKFPGLSGDNK